MAPATFSNSAGPGSATELSPVTIAVRDKIIEKFADLPLEDMNESVKRLLSQEKDEQKRLGILAARVFILRQRIVKLAEAEPERVIGSKSPDVDDALEANGDLDVGDEVSSEWTRLRILEDCEVNGVRFPRTERLNLLMKHRRQLTLQRWRMPRKALLLKLLVPTQPNL